MPKKLFRSASTLQVTPKSIKTKKLKNYLIKITIYFIQFVLLLLLLAHNKIVIGSNKSDDENKNISFNLNGTAEVIQFKE